MNNQILPPESYTLDQLVKILQDNIANAEGSGTFERLRTIGQYMGEPIETDNHGTYFIFCDWPSFPPPQLSPIIVVYREKVGRLVRGRGVASVWENIEELMVYLGPDDFHPSYKDTRGNPEFYKGLRVCKHEKSSHPTGHEERFIVPGQWEGLVIRHYPQAAQLKTKALLVPTDKARDELYKKMLLDKDI
jgi:hypothetical protein